jgi:hypothetical protein
MKTLLKIALVVVIAVVVINEIGRYVQAGEKLNDVTNQLSEWAQTNGRVVGRVKAGTQLASMGEQEGVIVTAYGQDDTTFTLYTQAPVEGSWVVGPFLAWRAKKSLSTPYTVDKQINNRPLN